MAEILIDGFKLGFKLLAAGVVVFSGFVVFAYIIGAVSEIKKTWRDRHE